MADAAAAEDDRVLAQVRAAAVHGVQADCERLNERAFDRRDVIRKLEAERRRMGNIPAECRSVPGRAGHEIDVSAEIVAAAQAVLALAAGHAGLHRDAVAGL